MSQGTFSDLLIPLEALKRIFVPSPKIDFLARSKPMVLGQKKTKFSSGPFLLLYVPRDLGVS